MKSFLIALLGLLLINSTGLAELLENGDFSKGINHWFLARNADYGVVTAAQVKDGALQLSKLTGPNPRYMGLSQPVDISEGTTYRVTFDYQASPDAKFSECRASAFQAVRS